MIVGLVDGTSQDVVTVLASAVVVVTYLRHRETVASLLVPPDPVGIGFLLPPESCSCLLLPNHSFVEASTSFGNRGGTSS